MTINTYPDRTYDAEPGKVYHGGMLTEEHARMLLLDTSWDARAGHRLAPLGYTFKILSDGDEDRLSRYRCVPR